MIVFHKSLKRSDDIVRSLKWHFEVNCKSIDAVIETFNNCLEQGYMIKILKSYNRDNDLAIWIYESLKDKNIKVAYGTLSNVDKNNNWIDEKMINFKEYPIVAEIKKKIIQNIFNNVREYYGLNEVIKISSEEDALKEILNDFENFNI